MDRAPPFAPPSQREEAAFEDRAPSGGGDEDIRAVETIHSASTRIHREIEKVIVGQKEVIDLLLVSLFAGGHSILTGVPGLAKTLLASTLSRLLSLSFKRIQFTPDLMPSDITGTDVLHEDRQSGSRTLRFLKGPIFTNMLLADEINRTPPKTQAALLEAMQERHVTVGEATYPLPLPFFVIATQNPIEQEGTYNLPEAQLDRFLFSIRVSYPREEEELEVMKRTTRPESIPLDRVLDGEEVLTAQRLVSRVPAAEHVHRFALRLVRSTRPEEPAAPPFVKECLSWGAGPRAAQSLIHAARSRALLHGRFHVTTGDVEALAIPVLAHRLVTNFHAESQGITATTLVEKLLAGLPRDSERARP